MKKFFTNCALALFILACSPEDGQDGAQGPQGEQGLSGADGEDGADGEQGDPGTANIIYSEWFPSEFANNINLSLDSFIVEVPGLTNEILENGLLLVFGRTINIIDEEQVEQLPRIVFFSDQYYYYRHSSFPDSSTDPLEFSIIVESTNGGFIGFPFFDDYRYFIIPGGVRVGGKSAQPDYTKMSYQQIIDLLNIPE